MRLLLIMKSKLCLGFILVVLSFPFLFVKMVEADYSATDPLLYFSPDSGFVGVDEEFYVDILLSTGGKDSISSRAVVLFDPVYLKVTKINSAETYCDYIDDTPNDYGVSNETGYVVVTGYCSTLYANETEPKKFARVYFKAMKEGSAQLEFRFNGRDEPGYSVIYDTNSPPVNIMLQTPTTASIRIVENANSYVVDNPATSVNYINNVMPVTIIMLVFGMGFVVYIVKFKK